MNKEAEYEKKTHNIAYLSTRMTKHQLDSVSEEASTLYYR